MDPNNNLSGTPSTTPMSPTEPSSQNAFEQLNNLSNELSNINPAAQVANAAMNGATPVVTTTDVNAMDVDPTPTIQNVPTFAPTVTGSQMPTFGVPSGQMPSNIMPPAPTATPVSLAPSAGFQSNATATVSAAPNGGTPSFAQDPLVAQELNQPSVPFNNPATTSSAPSVSSVPSAPVAPAIPDFSAEPAPDPNAGQNDPDSDEPLVPASPVPGSIGSARSYADIKREEAEIAARVAAAKNQKNKLSTKMIIIIAAAAVVLIGGIVAFIMIMNSSKTVTTTTTSVSPVAYQPTYKKLTCKRSIAKEWLYFNSISGIEEHYFYFEDGKLNGLVSNFTYTLSDAAAAVAAYNEVDSRKEATETWIDDIDSEYMASSDTTSDGTTSTTDSTSTTNSTSTTGVTTDTSTQSTDAVESLSQISINHNTIYYYWRWRVPSANIADYVKSDKYSDVAYGGTTAKASDTTSSTSTSTDTSSTTTSSDDFYTTHTLEYYKKIQNDDGFSCSETE